MRPLTLACLACAAATATAQNPSQVATLGCQNAAAAKVRTVRRDADSVRFAPGPKVSARGKSDRSVDGAGVYQDRVQREWHRFTYSCTYSIRSGAARATVRVDGDNGAKTKGGQGRG